MEIETQEVKHMSADMNSNFFLLIQDVEIRMVMNLQAAHHSKDLILG